MGSAGGRIRLDDVLASGGLWRGNVFNCVAKIYNRNHLSTILRGLSNDQGIE